MPCPHFTKRDNECAVFEQLPSEEEQSELVEPEQAPRRLCHSSGREYLHCPFYQRRLLEVRRAF